MLKDDFNVKVLIMKYFTFLEKNVETRHLVRLQGWIWIRMN
jgi:hypothetical protein